VVLPSSTFTASNFRTNEIDEIQRSNSSTIALGVPGAAEPKPDDLVAIVEEYRIGPGDTLSIKLIDFVALGTETDLTPIQVNELGYLDIAQLEDPVQAEGLPARELKAEIIQRAKDAGIYDVNSHPTVTVQVSSAQQRTFNVTGAIATPGLYPIVRPDFRLMEAVNLAGALDKIVKNIYVFRDHPREKVVLDSTGRMPRVGQPPASRPENVPTVRREPGALSSMARDAAPPLTPATWYCNPTSRLRCQRPGRGGNAQRHRADHYHRACYHPVDLNRYSTYTNHPVQTGFTSRPVHREAGDGPGRRAVTHRPFRPRFRAISLSR
jgi:protein involved in polysaccharide export with SLBB domain